LRCGQAGIGEHAALLNDEREVLGNALGLDGIDQAGTHGADAITHAGQLGFPHLPKFRRGQHGSNQGAAVDRRIGVVGADNALDLGQDASRFVLAGGDDGQRTDAFAVEREALGEGAGYEELQAGGREGANGDRVGIDAIGEALVGHVEERHQAARTTDIDDFLPLGVGEIGAGRIVAAGVQDDDRAGLETVKAGLHAGEVNTTRGGVVVRIVFDDKTRRFEKGAVVLPGGVADVNLGVRIEALQVIGTDLQGAGTAERLGGDDLALGDQFRVLAEQQVLHRLVVGRGAFDRLVATGQGGLDASVLGGLDGGEQGDLAVVVEIDANAEVDLGATGVGVERLVQAEDRVTRGHFHRSKDRRGHKDSME